MLLSFPPQGQLLLSCMSLIMCTEELKLGFLPAGEHKLSLLTCTGSSTVRFGPSRMTCIPFAASVLLIVASSQGNCPSLLSFGCLCKWSWIMGKLHVFTIFGDALKCPWLIIKGLLLWVGNNLIGIYLT